LIGPQIDHRHQRPFERMKSNIQSTGRGCGTRTRTRIVRCVSLEDPTNDPPLVIHGCVVEIVSRAELFMWQNLWNQGKEDADITDPVVVGRLRNLLRQRNSTEPASE
jgi:hypothetical protein